MTADLTGECRGDNKRKRVDKISLSWRTAATAAALKTLSKSVCGALIIHTFHFTKNLWAPDGTNRRLRDLVDLRTFNLMSLR